MESKDIVAKVRVCLGVPIFLLGVSALGADWPAYRADAARSGRTSEGLAFPLEKVWVYIPTQPPRPAWPEPGKELHRLDFDYAPQPVVAGGLVYFGSSADDTVRALDAETGGLRWRFTTGGPVRFAPAAGGGRLYVASDDGWLYSLDARTGKLVWKFRGAPQDDQLLGNGRMISRWPIRTGVLVLDGAVYFAAGMWPAQGVYLYALDARTGELIWCNDSSGSMYIDLPHPGASAFTGVAPQGYVLALGEILLVPTGRSVPAAFDRRTGRLLYYKPALSKHDGGAWATAAEGLYFTPRHGRGPDIDISIGESEPRPGDGLAAYSLATGGKELVLPGRHRAVCDGNVLYAVGNGTVQAIDLAAWREKKAPLSGAGGCVKWTASHPRAYCIALTERALLVGGAGSVTAFRTSGPAAGTQVWAGKVEGQVRGLAVADGRIVAGTSQGVIACFESREISVPGVVVRERRSLESSAPGDHVGRASKLIEATGVTRGYALVVGESDPPLATALASQTDLHVICVLHEGVAGEAERERLVEGGLYGSRVVVQGLDDLSRLPYASYFADLVVASGDVSDLDGEELYRVLRPCGGVLCFPDVSRRNLKRLLKGARAPRNEIHSAGKLRMVVRGELAGAGEWRSQWADGGNTGIGEEARVRPPFEMLWFGGPGPDRMMSRHWGASAPLSVAGRVFVAGQHHVIAFDAYNGRELWCRELKGAGRRGAQAESGNFVADDDSLYVAARAFCHRLDQATGKTLAVYGLPELAPEAPPREPRRGVEAKEPPPVDVEWPEVWQVFGPLPKGTLPLPEETLKAIPEGLTVGEKTYAATPFRPVRGKIDFTYLYGGYGYEPLKPGEKPEDLPRGIGARDTESLERVAYAFAKIDCPAAGRLTIGAGADWWMQWFLDGKPIFDTLARGNRTHPYSVTNHVFSVDVTAGEHVVAVMVRAGSRGWCVCSVGGAKHERFLRYTPPERNLPRWGYLSVAGDLILGSYIGRRARNSRRAPTSESQAVFALEKTDGSLRWAYRSERTVLNTNIAFAVGLSARRGGDGRVFILDATSPHALQQAERRAEEIKIEQTLVALDMKTGVELWRQDDVRKRYVQYANQVVVVGASAGYDAETGLKLWQRGVASRRLPLIRDDWIIAQPQAYHLRTGEPRMTTDILTGERRPWRFARAYGCGPIAGCRRMLFFRSGAAGFFDFAYDGTTTFGGVRPGCSITMIPAGGLMILPEGSSACTCSYNFQTSLALIPTVKKGNPWYAFAGQRSEAVPQQLRINLGAPGDRRDAYGTPWLGFPRPVIGCPVPVRLTKKSEWCRGSEGADVRGTDRPWIYTSGLNLASGGPHRITIDIERAPVVVPICKEPPAVDGELDDACWKGAAPIPFEADSHLLEPKTTLFMCRDTDRLYFAYRKKAALRGGKPVPFTAEHPEKDAPEASRDDDFEIFLTDSRRGVALHLGVNAAGGGFEGRTVVAEKRASDLGWNGEWSWAVKKGERAWTAEVAIPFDTLRAEKIDPARLQVNCMSQNVSGRGTSRVYLTHPLRPFGSSQAFVPVTGEPVRPPERTFTVRLHFAYLRTGADGRASIGDVAIQGRTVLKDFDISKDAAGAVAGGKGALVAVVKEFRGVRAHESITIDLEPKREGAASSGQRRRPDRAAPILCGLEVIAEESP